MYYFTVKIINYSNIIHCSKIKNYIQNSDSMKHFIAKCFNY